MSTPPGPRDYPETSRRYIEARLIANLYVFKEFWELFPEDKAEKLAIRLFHLATELADGWDATAPTFVKDILQTVGGLAVGWMEHVQELKSEHLPAPWTQYGQFRCATCGPFEINLDLRCPSCGTVDGVTLN